MEGDDDRGHWALVPGGEVICKLRYECELVAYLGAQVDQSVSQLGREEGGKRRSVKNNRVDADTGKTYNHIRLNLRHNQGITAYPLLGRTNLVNRKSALPKVEGTLLPVEFRH